MAQVKRKKKAKKASGKSMAKLADKHILYQAAVQSTEFEIEFYEDRYKELRGKRATPLSLREDFCGTALLCADWCASNPKRTAIGVDLCSDTLKWGLEHNIKPAKVQDRVTLVNENVLDVVSDKMDVICAMNFSYCIFNTRDLMRSYFENVRKGLKDDGLFFMDLLGGTTTIDTCEEDRELEGLGATYHWEQESFNPINNEMQCYIHFEFD
ncbi:MAG: class I SAM-dependent methyltransferase, partial [Gammaproteobacteria bacterium]|nr:class I SAM-dependent methyltransferase [Gammaproteobacteria bacterium]